MKRVIAGGAVLSALLAGAGAGAVPASASAPVPRWIHVAAGLRFSCGIREGNSLWCWGAGQDGELGLGSNANEIRPHQITWPTTGWTSVTAGYQHACAIRA